MKYMYDELQILRILNKQISNYWDYVISDDKLDIIRRTLELTEECHRKRNSQYYHKDGKSIFNIMNTVQYAIFLYRLSHELFIYGYEKDAECIYYLNKIMHSVDWFFAINLPLYFGAEHPMASVLGRAKYGEYFFVYQGVTVGGNNRGGKIEYPEIGRNVVMYSNSKVIGNSKIGDNVIIAANTYIKDTDIPCGSIVYGSYPNLVIKRNYEEKIEGMLSYIWQR